MELNSKIYVAGHNGMVGSAIVRKLKDEGYNNLILKSHDDLDLTNQKQVESFFDLYEPEYVFLAAARVGGIVANNTYPAEFINNNLLIQTNVIHQCYTYNVKKLLFLGSSCFKPGTLVITSNGLKNIEDINVNDIVLTHKNNFKKVYNVTKNIFEDKLKRVKFFGWGDVQCTPDHEILTKNGYKKAEDLTNNDYVLIPINIPNEINDNIDIFDIEYKIMYNSYKEILTGVSSPLEIIKKNDIFSNKKSMVYKNTPIYSFVKNDIIDLKTDLSKLCGYFLAEGWLCGKDTEKRGSQHTIMFSPGYDINFANDIKQKLKNIFGIEPHFELCETTYKVGYCSNKIAYLFFKKFYSDDSEHKAYTKSVPDIIINSSNDSIKEFIKGYWRGDGHFRKRKERNNVQYVATCSSTSKILIYQLQQLLLRFKIISNVSFHKKKEKSFITSKKTQITREINQKSQWELRITGKYAIDFIENILDVKLEDKFLGSNSHYFSTFFSDHLEIRVKKIIDINYNGFVYDLSVEDDISYTANGIAVHNCIYPRDCQQPIKEDYFMTGALEKTNDAYAVAKIAGIKMCQAYNKQYGSNFISLMPTNLYGIGDNYDLENSHVFPAMIRKFHEAKLRNENNITLWGTGSPYREFLHVNDLADATLFLMNNYNSSEIINVGTGEDLTIKDLALLMKKITNFKGEIIFDSTRPDGTPKKLLDVSKLHNLGWKHSIELEIGLIRTYEDYLMKIL